MNNLKRSYKKHAKKRLRERMGITMNKNIRAQILKGIKNCRYDFVTASKNGRQLFKVTDIRKKPFNVV